MSSAKHDRIRDPGAAVTIRVARAEDAAALDRLAILDSQPVPAGLKLCAEVGGELWAAYSVRGRSAIADPFRPSGELVPLLEARAAQLRRASSEVVPRRRWRRAAALLGAA